MPKASKSSKGVKQKTYTPTGIRRFFFKLELLGGKRRRDRPSFDQDKEYSTATPPSTKAKTPPQPYIASRYGKENVLPPALPPLGRNFRLPSRVALQNEDTAEDAVVITALDTPPFCCHEDLITMSREQLIHVALALNAKLPAAMAIDVSPALSTSFIRSSIELIVGLRGDVPQAPKPVRWSRAENEVYLLDSVSDTTISPPTSPLAMHGRKNGENHHHMSLVRVTPRLERLEEVEEGGTIGVKGAERYPKRRKVLAEVLRPLADPMDVEMGGEGKAEAEVQMHDQQQRMRRTQSDRMSSRPSGIPRRVLRSQSQKIEAPDRAMTGIDTSFVNTKRPVYRYKNKVKQSGDAEGPGSQRKAAILLRPVSRHRCFGPPTPEKSGVGSRSRSRSNTVSRAASSSSQRTDGEESWTGLEAPVVGVKRKRSLSRTEAERQMVAGIRKMSMRKSQSDDMETN